MSEYRKQRRRRICQAEVLLDEVCHLRPMSVPITEQERETAIEGFKMKVSRRVICPLTKADCLSKWETDPGRCIPFCDVCKGTGLVYYDVDTYDPRFGQVKPCPNYVKSWSEATGISSAEKDRLDSLVVSQRADILELRTAMSALTEKGSGLLYIYGKPGIGKTTIAQLHLISVYNKSQNGCLYYRHDDLMAWLSSSYDERQGQNAYLNRLNSLYSVDLLIIDEIGRARSSEFTKKTTETIIDRRYRQAINGESSTILLSNGAPESQFDHFIVDRLRDARCRVYHSQGESLRPVADRIDPFVQRDLSDGEGSIKS